MEITPITLKCVDELLQFLPMMDTPGQDLDPLWRGADSAPGRDNVLIMPYPIYPPAVTAFFWAAGQPCWSDYDYNPALAAGMVHSDEAIAAATLDEIKTLLTYCVRGERFVDGHWGAMVRSGRIGAILRRLAQLRVSIEER